jgi:SAM-dependent methyltransferase
VHGARFEWIVASHVIEHMPDLAGFLNSCGRILAVGGILSLAVPDKRYCFDCERENSSLARVIDAALVKPVTHSPGTAAEHFLKVRRKGGKIAWKHGHRGALEPVHGLQDAMQAMTMAKDGLYQDLHAWVFTDESFRQLIRDLRDLRLINLQERSFTSTQGCEFFMTLARADASATGPVRRGAAQAPRDR